MTVPKMSKTDWFDAAKARAAVEAAIARADEALTRGGDDVAAAYRELTPLLDRELENSTFIDDATDARWRAAMARLHEAQYGFPPARAKKDQLEKALPDISPERLASLVPIAGDIAEYADGGTLNQIANLLVKEAKKRDLSVTRAEARRIVAALEGAPIPLR